MKRPLLPAALALGLLAQCHRADPTPPPAPDPLSLLPAETQTGAGTFGCLVNGQAYTAPFNTLANGDWASPTKLAINGSLYENGDYTSSKSVLSLVLNGNLSDGKPSSFNLIPAGVPNTVFTNGVNQFFASANAPINNYYSGQYIKNGQVVLTKFDGPNRVASGRFFLTLYKLNSADTLRVTNGRFDVKF